MYAPKRVLAVPYLQWFVGGAGSGAAVSRTSAAVRLARAVVQRERGGMSAEKSDVVFAEFCFIGI